MNRPRYEIPASAAVLAFVIASMLASGCVAPRTYNQARAERNACPGNLRLQCSHRTAEPEKCTCVTQGEMERTVEELMRSPDPVYKQ